MEARSPVVVIVGPTASGKTGLAVKLAKKFGGEIICADSRTIYKGMDIGTAKPTEEERQGVLHWGLDLVEPGEYFSASDFKHYADRKITEIRRRGHIPFLVGGTGLYVDSVLFGYEFGVKADSKLREYMQKKSVQELKKYCKENNIELPENSDNKRYIVRSIENNNKSIKISKDLQDNYIVVGITTSKEDLLDRIRSRATRMFTNGVIEEANSLAEKYGWDSEAMTSNIYQLIRKKELSIEEMQNKSITLDWRLAKRQMTWFRRNKFIKWHTLEEAEKYISSLLVACE